MTSTTDHRPHRPPPIDRQLRSATTQHRRLVGCFTHPSSTAPIDLVSGSQPLPKLTAPVSTFYIGPAMCRQSRNNGDRHNRPYSRHDSHATKLPATWRKSPQTSIINVQIPIAHARLANRRTSTIGPPQFLPNSQRTQRKNKLPTKLRRPVQQLNRSLHNFHTALCRQNVRTRQTTLVYSRSEIASS